MTRPRTIDLIRAALTGDEPWWLSPLRGGADDGDKTGDKGGDDKGDKTGDDKEEDDADDDELDEDTLDDKVKAVLAKEREKRKTATRDAKTTRSALKTLTAEIAALKKAGKPDQDAAAVAKAAELAATETLAKANKRIVAAAIQMAAAGKLKSPQLAARFIDADDFEVDDKGEVDTAKIEQAIADLLEESPELAADKVKTKSGGDFSGKGGGEKPDMNKLLRMAAGRGAG